MGLLSQTLHLPLGECVVGGGVCLSSPSGVGFLSQSKDVQLGVFECIPPLLRACPVMG